MLRVKDSTIANRRRGPRKASHLTGKRLSVAQIKSRYKSEWILIKDPVVDKDQRVINGEVVCHSKDRDEIDRKAVQLRLKHSAFLYTGELPKNAAILI